MSPLKCEPVVPVRAKPEGDASSDRLALLGQQWRVGGDYDDHRAATWRTRHGRFERVVVGDCSADVEATDREFMTVAEVGLHQSPDGVGVVAVLHDA